MLAILKQEGIQHALIQRLHKRTTYARITGANVKRKSRNNVTPRKAVYQVHKLGVSISSRPEQHVF